LVKTRIEHNPQEKIYHDIIGFSHEIEDTSLDLLNEIANIEKQKFSQKANSPEGASNPRFTDRYEALIHETTNYIKKLEGFRNKELDRVRKKYSRLRKLCKAKIWQIYFATMK